MPNIESRDSNSLNFGKTRGPRQRASTKRLSYVITEILNFLISATAKDWLFSQFMICTDELSKFCNELKDVRDRVEDVAAYVAY